MIFPYEYKTIGVTKTTDSNYDEKKAYFLSKYIIKINDNDTKKKEYIIKQITHKGNGIIRKVINEKKISNSNETFYFEKKVNITNRQLLITIANKICNKYQKKAVIFNGHDKHLTFIYKPDISTINTIEILDIEPPVPSKLYDCIKRLDKANLFGDLCIKFKKKIFSLKTFENKNTIFPCSCSDLEGQFLDKDLILKNKQTLIGCNTSKLIFNFLYPKIKYDFIELCPIKSKYLIPTNHFITRCCKKEFEGQIIFKNKFIGIVVHWGSSEYIISKNIRKLIRNLKYIK